MQQSAEVVSVTQLPTTGFLYVLQVSVADGSSAHRWTMDRNLQVSAQRRRPFLATCFLILIEVVAAPLLAQGETEAPGGRWFVRSDSALQVG